MSFENYDASNGESSEEFGFEPGYDAFPDAGVFRETQTTLHPDYRLVAEMHWNESDAETPRLIEELKEAARREGLSVPDYYHLYVKYLRGGGMDVATALQIIKSLIREYRVTPNLFKDLLPLSKGEKVFRQNFGSVLPFRDQRGRRHFLIIAGNWDPSEVSFDEAWSALYKTIELISLEPKTQVAGCSVIIDASGFSMRHFLAIKLEHQRAVVNFVQKSFPIWFREFHIIKAFRLAKAAYNLLKPFLQERVKESINFHDSFEELHEYVSPDSLPEEFGGTRGPFETRVCQKALQNFEGYFEEVRRMADENSDKL